MVTLGMMDTVLLCIVGILGAAVAVSLSLARRHAAAAQATASQLTHLRGDLERCQQLLAQTDRLSSIGMLAASMAHEVRNPLVSVRTFAQLMPERLHDEEFRTSFRDLALGEIDRICLLVNDLLAFARPSAPEVHATDLNDILSQIRRLVDGEAKKRGLEFFTHLDPALPMVPVDEARVKQVFLNIVLNAIHACEAGGTVQLTTRDVQLHGAAYFQVEVRDSGRGIPPEHIGRIFDPFFTTKKGGSGLGLFIADKIVREHAGTIEVRSDPGKGTSFHVSFPLSATTSAEPPNGSTVGRDANDRSHRSVP